MAKQLLPNGSVVTLKGATKKLMTIGIEVEMEGDEKTYDYIAIPYPEGYIDSETMFLFMQEDIENVSFVGFVDAEMQVFRTALEETDAEPSFASCIRCGACAAVCSNDALSVGSIEKVIDGETVTRDRIEFNPYKCNECGDCIEACPYNMLHATGNEKFPIMGFCTLCGQCIDACPKHALYDV